MEHPVGRTIRVFLLLIAAAGFYRLTVVPLVESRPTEQAVALEPTAEEAAEIRARAEGRLAAVGEMFPPGSWERSDPTVVENRQVRLLFKQYHSLPDGRVNLVPCTMVILPETEGGRTIVMRAPQGAVLQFAEPFDLREGKLSKLVGGSLRGQITIRGTETAKGAEDDLEITTRDVELVGDEVRSSEQVLFRHGRSTGSGRSLVARLLSKPGGSEQGPNISGVDSIRLERDVRLKLEGLGGGMLPGSPTSASVADSAEPAAESPVNVSCRGGLTLHMAANLITLEDHVDVTRSLPGGGSDQLACDFLSIAIEKQKSGGMAARDIEAKGKPVIVRSTSAGLEARANRLGYEIATRRILLDGEQPVSLVARDVQMEARSIDYVPGPPGDPGSLMAVGPGWLTSNAGAGSRPATVRFRKWLRMKRDGDEQVASISGDAEVVVDAQGRLAASEIHLWLEVVKGARPGSAATAPVGPDLSGVRPSRLLARGMVQVEAEQLAARTDQMEVWFRHLAAAPEARAPKPVAVVAAPISRPAAVASVSRPAAVASAPQRQAAAPPAAPRRDEPPSRGRIIASGGKLRAQVTLAPKGQEVEEMSLEGQVHLVEEPLHAAHEKKERPLEIRGDQVQLSRPTRFDARAVVAGRPATVSGRGADLEGPLVEFDRGRNRLTVDGAGRLAFDVQPGAARLDALTLSGPPKAPAAAGPDEQPGRLDVAWRGRMEFDGQTARFIDSVVATSGEAKLATASLDVILDRRVLFGVQPNSASGVQPNSASGVLPNSASGVLPNSASGVLPNTQADTRPDVARIGCGGGVRIESTSTASDGTRSMEKLTCRDMLVDRLTGDVTGNGPGRLSTTRFGQPPGMMSPPSGTGGPAARPDELTYLGVDFQRGLRGNIHRRTMEFHQRVEAVWGPVASWESTLDVHAPGGLPPRAVGVSSDVLGVSQAAQPQPAGRRGTFDLQATGNVLVEGDTFTARSGRLSWSEAKDLLVFEGDGRSDAQLFRQLQVGAPTSSASAGRILYWRALNRVDVDDARYLDLDQFGGNAAGMQLPGMGGQARR